MVYIPQTWTNGSVGGTPVSAARMDVIEQGIADAHALAATGLSGWHDVTAYGALGNGSTDDTAEIQAAIAAAGVGGTVYFPKSSGNYMISTPLTALDSQTWVGQHSPRYASTMPIPGTQIRATAGFTGTALITNSGNKKGVTFRYLSFAGNGVNSTLNGIDMGPNSGGERMWQWFGCQFSEFGGAAICGQMWVADIRDCHFVQNGYAIRPSAGTDTTSGALDVRILGSQIYFNKLGGIWLDSATGRSGGVTIGGCRIERSGSDPANTAVNRNNNAHGIKLVKGTGFNFFGNYSDANSGYGLLALASVLADVNVLTCTGNVWNRDSTGGQSVPESRAGIRLVNTDRVSFYGDKISYGSPNDAGGGTVTPQYGLELEGTYYTEWNGSINLAVASVANGFRLVSGNYRAILNEPRLRSTVASGVTADRPVSGLADGAWFFDTTLNRPIWHNGSGWVDSAGTTV